MYFLIEILFYLDKGFFQLNKSNSPIDQHFSILFFFFDESTGLDKNILFKIFALLSFFEQLQILFDSFVKFLLLWKKNFLFLCNFIENTVQFIDKLIETRIQFLVQISSNIFPLFKVLISGFSSQKWEIMCSHS